MSSYIVIFYSLVPPYLEGGKVQVDAMDAEQAKILAQAERIKARLSYRVMSVSAA